MLVSVILLVLGVGAPAAHAAGETISYEQTVVANGSESQAVTVASGEGVTTVLKYRCNSSGNPCRAG